MRWIGKYIGRLYLTTLFYVSFGVCIAMYIVSFFYDPFEMVPNILIFVFIALFLIDYIFLFFVGGPMEARRIIADRLSNGDENKVELQIRNTMNFAVKVEVIDEL